MDYFQYPAGGTFFKKNSRKKQELFKNFARMFMVSYLATEFEYHFQGGRSLWNSTIE
jgi:hypothetical protein